jgi:hypothetical protein
MLDAQHSTPEFRGSDINVSHGETQESADSLPDVRPNFIFIEVEHMRD